PIIVRFNDANRYNESAILNQPITFRNNSGQLVQIPISPLVEKTNIEAFNVIKRKDLKRVITLYSNVLGGYNPTEIVNELKQDLDTYNMPEGITFKFTGEQEKQAENQAFLLKALLLALGG